MKTVKSFCVLLSLLLIIPFSGCKETGKTITFAANESIPFDFENAIKEYNKTSKTKIKAVSTKKRESADIFTFSVKEFDSIKDLCGNLENLADKLDNKNLAFREEAYTYGLPVLSDYSAVIYKKSDFGEIGDFNSFKNAVRNAKLNYKTAFALSRQDKESICDALLGTMLFYEFETGDDYSFPPNAAYHSKKLAFRYKDELKDLLDIAKDNVIITESTAEAVNMVKSGEAAFTVFNSGSKALDIEDDLSLCPLALGIDGESSASFPISEDYFFAVNKNIPAENLTAANSFLIWLFENGENYLKNKASIFPYKSDNNNQSGIKRMIAKSLIENRSVILSVSAAFPDGFSAIAADGIIDYLESRATFEYTEKLLLAAWESGKRQ